VENEKKLNLGERLLLFNELLLLGVLIVIALLITIGEPKFISILNLKNIIRDSSQILIAGIGMTMLLIAGDVDLSIGSLVAFSTVVFMDVVNKTNSFWLGLLACLVLGAVVGLVNGIVAAKFKVSALIGTIAMMMILRGSVYLYSIASIQNFHHLDIFTAFGNGYFGPFPVPVVIMVVLFTGFYIVINKTVFGRRLYATGGNAEAARISGIRTSRMRIQTFVMSSTLAALSGAILCSRMNSGQPNAGNGYELTVIAGVILGGTSLAGGKGTLIGTLLGVLIMRIINNGIILLQWNQDLQTVFSGIVIILAVFLDNKRQAAKAKIITT
jgi:ribose transport system permease protein